MLVHDYGAQFSYVLSKDHLATNDLYHEVKPLDYFLEGRSSENLILIDNNFFSCNMYFNNLIPIETFTSKESDSDKYLEDLRIYLMQLNSASDVRKRIAEDYNVEEILSESRASKMKKMKQRASDEEELLASEVEQKSKKEEDSSDDEFE